MNLKSIGNRFMRDTARQIISRAKNKIITKTTGTILKRVPKTKDPLLNKAGRSMTRQAVRTLADLFIGYGRKMTKKSGQQLILTGALLLPLTAWGNVTITTPTETISVVAEIADEPTEWQQGLMFRKQLSDNAGMLFIFDKQQQLTMWMKNTLIPLDMLFFDKSGKIITIARDTKPLDKTLIYSKQPALGVLEVNAGFAAKHNINTGDTITYD